MSVEAYAILKEFCDARMEAIALAAREMRERSLPLFIIHPATLQADRPKG